MSTHDRQTDAPPQPRGWPLAWRLPLSISGVIVIALAIFLWAAYRRVETTLLTTGGERARLSAVQVASIFERSETLGRAGVQRLAALPSVQQLLEKPDDAQVREAARLALMPPTSTAARRVEVWSASGERLFEASRPTASQSFPEPREIPPATWPMAPGTTPIQVANGIIFYDRILQIQPAAGGVRPGLLVVRAPLSVNPPGALTQLIGPDARLLIGSRNGAWTDMVTAVDRPPLERVTQEIGTFRDDALGARLGALIQVRDTPWLVWVDLPRDPVVAPAAGFLRRMAIIAALVVVIAAIAVRIVTNRITTPLETLNDAAAAISSGDYGRRVPASASGELGRLAHSFNTMAGNIEDSRRVLEARIEERTNALDALSASEARYRAIIDVALDCIVTIDVQGSIQEFNPAAERVFGYRRADAVGRELAELIIPPRFRDLHRRGMAHFLESGEGQAIGRLIEMIGMRADGTEFPVELAITTIDTVSRGRLFTGVIRDITNRKRAEAALVESERAFRATFDEAPLGIAQVSVEGRWLRVNRRVTALFQYDADELLGNSFAEIFPTEQDDRDGDSWRTVMAGAGRDAGQERPGVCKSGQQVWVNLTVSAHVDEVGSPLYYIVIMEDTSERRRLEEQLRQSQKMEAIGQLAGGVAHDFNNLLTAILGYAHLLADEFTDEDPRRRDVEEIVRAAERSAALTRQLLAFSRKQVLQPRIVNMNTLVSETADMLRRVIGEHIELVTALEPGLNNVCVDPTQLEQIVMNLAVNARDAMPGGGRLTLQTANVHLDDTPRMRPVNVVPGPYVMLAVSDTGVGMSEETQRRLFEPFFTTKEQGRGTGLGLATVYGIVKQSGGYIWVYSEPWNGATFKVYLPVAVPSADSVDGDGIVSSTRGDETILIVEDERAVRVLARLMLERAGYRVLDAEGPDEATEIFAARASDIDLLISDVVMPGSHGPALYKHLSRRVPGLKVLFMSGYTDDEIVHAGRIEPGVAFIEKPFTATRLTQKVREVLDRGTMA